METNEFDYIFSEYEGSEDDLIPILQKTQGKYGYISKEAIKHISRFLKISENQVYGVASFYSQFRFTRPGRNSIRICMGTACHVKGGQILCDSTEREIGVPPGQTTEDGRFDFERVACLGCCALAPVAQINNSIYSQLSVIKLQEIIKKYE